MFKNAVLKKIISQVVSSVLSLCIMMTLVLSSSLAFNSPKEDDNGSIFNIGEPDERE